MYCSKYDTCVREEADNIRDVFASNGVQVGHEVATALAEGWAR